MVPRVSRHYRERPSSGPVWTPIPFLFPRRTTLVTFLFLSPFMLFCVCLNRQTCNWHFNERRPKEESIRSFFLFLKGDSSWILEESATPRAFPWRNIFVCGGLCCLFGQWTEVVVDGLMLLPLYQTLICNCFFETCVLTDYVIFLHWLWRFMYVGTPEECKARVKGCTGGRGVCCDPG